MKTINDIIAAYSAHNTIDAALSIYLAAIITPDQQMHLNWDYFSGINHAGERKVIIKRGTSLSTALEILGDDYLDKFPNEAYDLMTFYVVPNYFHEVDSLLELLPKGSSHMSGATPDRPGIAVVTVNGQLIVQDATYPEEALAIAILRSLLI